MTATGLSRLWEAAASAPPQVESGPQQLPLPLPALLEPAMPRNRPTGGKRATTRAAASGLARAEKGEEKRYVRGGCETTLVDAPKRNHGRRPSSARRLPAGPWRAALLSRPSRALTCTNQFGAGLRRARRHLLATMGCKKGEPRSERLLGNPVSPGPAGRGAPSGAGRAQARTSGRGRAQWRGRELAGASRERERQPRRTFSRPSGFAIAHAQRPAVSASVANGAC